MQAYVIRHYIGPAGLERCELPVPHMAHGEVRVKVKAVSLNHRDLMIAKGEFAAMTSAELIPMSDAAGEVIDVGAGVTRCRAGDRVMAIFNPDWIGGDWSPSPGLYGRVMGIPGVLCEEIPIIAGSPIGIRLCCEPLAGAVWTE